MRIEHPYSLLVRESGFAWSCGQCPLSAEGAVLAPGDLVAQGTHVDGYIRRLLEKADLAPASVGKLVIYHEAGDVCATERMLSLFRAAYPGAILLPVATPFFYYEGMRIEVDVHAAERRAPLVTREEPGFRLHAVDAGDLVWASIEAARTLDPHALAEALHAAGVSAEALLGDHWFVSADATAEALATASRADLVTDPGAAAGVALPAGIVAMGELTFAGGGATETLARSAHSGIALTARCSPRHFWISARSDSPALSLVGETKAIMAAISSTMAAQGWRFESVVKATTHYVGSSAAQDLHDNMAVRNAYYRRPGPASTGLPIAAFPLSRSKITVDVLGVVEG
jgi:enamine deaminase RidA (YjgF/YER057c/UK114 family)